jgi:hypothetical protein
MTALTRTPEAGSFLQPTKYLLTFDRIKTVQFYCQSVNIPGINLGQAPISTPMLDIFAPGNKITYNPLNIHFLVDEKLQSWQELHAWFRSIASPESFDERKRLGTLQNQYSLGGKRPQAYSDATLTVLSSLNNPILRVKFYNMFPITLSDIIFDSAQSADDVISADAVFIFDYFDFEYA